MSPIDAFDWPDSKECAVSLTYDDARACHHELVAPALERAGLRATFYIRVLGEFCRDVEQWRSIARAGHELGNHTLFHPCRSHPGKEKKWLNPAYNLCSYNERRFRDEIRLTNWILEQIDGKDLRSYGNTCHENHIGHGETLQCIEPILAEFCAAARGVHTGTHVDLAAFNAMNLGTSGADGCTFEELRERIEAARKSKSWIIFTAHGITKDTRFSEKEHARLTAWLGEQRDSIWTAPVVEIASWCKSHLPQKSS
jgi:sialate O-acetylesterase